MRSAVWVVFVGVYCNGETISKSSKWKNDREWVSLQHNGMTLHRSGMKWHAEMAGQDHGYPGSTATECW
jgi:hypothetical protein